MKIYQHPTQDQWPEITARPRLDLTELNETAAAPGTKEALADAVAKMKAGEIKE